MPLEDIQNFHDAEKLKKKKTKKQNLALRTNKR